MSHSPDMPSIFCRLASMFYEALLLAAVLFIAGFIFTAAFQPLGPILRAVLQIYLLLVIASYFIWYWLHGGQTLPMKTWRLRLVSADDQPLTLKQACWRFILALIGTLLGFGILWAWFDRDRLFWHDRIAKTKIVLTKP